MLDKNTMFADGLAYNGSPANYLDLGPRPGPGEKFIIWAQGSSNFAGGTGLTIVDGPTTSPANALLTYTCTLAGKTVEIELPSDTDRYVKVTLAGSPSAGTWSCGIGLKGQQTSQ